MDNNVQKTVLKAVAEALEEPKREIRLGASLREDLGFDSLRQMTLFILLEDEFHRSMAPEEVTGIVTVQDIIDFINRKLQDPAPA